MLTEPFTHDAEIVEIEAKDVTHLRIILTIDAIEQRSQAAPACR